jgi:hypothetical protein
VTFPWRFNCIDDGAFSLRFTVHNKIPAATLA